MPPEGAYSKPHTIPSTQGTQDSKHSVSSIEGILVCTGVYKHGIDADVARTDSSNHAHRDFNITPDLLLPSKIVDNVYDAVKYILGKEL